MMQRRAFVAGMATVMAAPRSAPAQQAGRMPRLGILLSGSASTAPSLPEVDVFMSQLAAFGWVDGQNLVVERRWGEGHEQMAQLADDLVRANVDVMLTPGPNATEAARAATSTIPIVMVASSDPRVFGVPNIARPSGNLTGLTIGQPEVVVGKRLELLKEMIPGLSRVAVL
jgi:putative ABC transport system substrate-binding protein